ncbi:MAG TPA: hypothetical protein PKB02_19135 [Anaerohalosphaeraceae bacterium]|nr:hypothetical protein [Anaerohalosphaeraceae bacterium]
MIDIFFHPMISLDEGPIKYFSVLGRALFTAQHFETNCRALAGFLNMRVEIITKGSDVLNAPEFHNRINSLWRKTLGGQITAIQKIIQFPNDISQIIDEARNARNEVAHGITVGIGDNLDSELNVRIDEIRRQVKKIATADKYVAALLHIFNRDQLPNGNYFREYERKIDKWVCEPVFDK